MKEGQPIVNNILKARSLDIGILSTPRLYNSRMTVEEANSLTWDEFKTRMQPFASVQSDASQVEYIFTPKSPTWTFKDINVFVGEPNRRIATIADLNDEEGRFLFDIHLKTARSLISEEDKETHFSIGFNEEDLLPGHHTINSRLHTHLYVADNPRIDTNRQPTSLRELDWFERLSLVEPMIPVFYDYMQNQLAEGLFNGYLQNDGVNLQPGYISLSLRDSDDTQNVFPDIRKFFINTRAEYNKVEALFTDRRIDPDSGRYIPLPLEERQARVSAYIEENGSWISDASAMVLTYLGSHVREAKKTGVDRKTIHSPENVWFTKGFAGAMNFVLSPDIDSIRFDFLPCALSTSSMNKVLIKEGLPTLLRRGASDATDEDKKYAAAYYHSIQQVLMNHFSNETTLLT